MKALVTGGAGFIGSHIVELLYDKAEVVVLDNLRTGYMRNIAPFVKTTIVPGSICDRDSIRRAMRGVDCVFHLAALISVPESMEKIRECVDINVKGLLNVYEAAAEAGVKKLVFSTSAAIYGDNPVVPKVETMVPEPKSPYAVTKLDGEYYAKMFSDLGRLKVACLRYFNVFGPRQDPHSAYAAAVPIFIERALKNLPITIYGDGEQTRDFIFVKDVGAANFFMAQSEATGVFNVAYGGRQTINELVETIIRLTGSKSEIIHAPDRAGDVKHSMADVSKLKAAGFVPQYTFAEGLRQTIEFFKSK
ncbi:MAG: NAD-dependent epimerase/dehydratase family protein [Victivallaceae bacterium]|nr:NAD-dependent epimerase/dehydratase family protein [Victivallaceae bacterium]